MDKEKEPIFTTDEGYSEKKIDLAVDQIGVSDPKKSGNIFISPFKKKKT